MCSGNQAVENQDLALQKSQTAMAQTLNNSYAQSFANQQNVLAAQQARLSAEVANPQGYTPQQLAGATTSINENTATAAKQAIGSAAAYAAAHGGADVGSGAAGEIAGQIGSAAAQAKSQQLSQLSQQNQAMKQANYWNGIQGLNQVGSAYGQAAGTAAGSSAGVASSGSQAGEAAFQAQGPSTLGSIAQFAAEAGGDVAAGFSGEPRRDAGLLRRFTAAGTTRAFQLRGIICLTFGRSNLL